MAATCTRSVHTTTVFLLKMLLLPCSEKSQLTCRLPEKHPLLFLLHQPVKETKSNTSDYVIKDYLKIAQRKKKKTKTTGLV